MPEKDFGEYERKAGAGVREDANHKAESRFPDLLT